MHGTKQNSFTTPVPMASQTAGFTSMAAATGYSGAGVSGGPATTPGILATLLGLTVLYVVWGILQKAHDGIREQVQPRNIAHNVHNFLTITLTVIIGLVITKIVIAKLAGWGIPGMTPVATVVDAA